MLHQFTAGASLRYWTVIIYLLTIPIFDYRITLASNQSEGRELVSKDILKFPQDRRTIQRIF